MSLTIALIAVTLVAGIAAALAETTRGGQGYGPLKMLAASGYLGLALHLDALASPYGRLLFLALALSWLGDLLLVGSRRRAFLAGLAAFLLAHLAFAAAFATELRLLWPAAVAAPAMLLIGIAVLRWLGRHGIPEAMRTPVVAYLAAIGLMVSAAATTMRPTILIGAAAFTVSDLFVARQRLVQAAPVNRLVGLPLYFAAQLLIILSLQQL